MKFDLILWIALAKLEGRERLGRSIMSFHGCLVLRLASIHSFAREMNCSLSWDGCGGDMVEIVP